MKNRKQERRTKEESPENYYCHAFQVEDALPEDSCCAETQ